jgi:hypothetical protein
MVTSRMSSPLERFAALFSPPRPVHESKHPEPKDEDHNKKSTETAISPRCQFTFSDGRQCRMQRAQFCSHHSSREEREGRGNGFPDTVLEAHALEALCADLTTATNINRALSQVFLLMAQGRIPQKQAVAFGYLSQLLLQTAPGIRSEYVSVHGYGAWEQKLKSSLEANQSPEPSPVPSGGENQQPASAHEKVEPEEGEYYADIYRRSLDLLDRKYDTTPEGRREANALLLELELMNPAPEKPRRDFLGQTADLVRRLHEHESEISVPPTPASQSLSVPRPSAPAPPKTALAEPPAAPAPPATPDPALCSSGRGAAQPALRVLSESAAARPIASQAANPPHFDNVSTSKTNAPAPSPSAAEQFPPPRRKRQAPPPTNRSAHGTDWYAPASWSEARPNPFPSRQEKLKRKLRTMSDRRSQHQNQSRAFWR